MIPARGLGLLGFTEEELRTTKTFPAKTCRGVRGDWEIDESPHPPSNSRVHNVDGELGGETVSCEQLCVEAGSVPTKNSKPSATAIAGAPGRNTRAYGNTEITRTLRFRGLLLFFLD